MIVKKSGLAKHIIIATTAIVAALLIGFLTYEKPNNHYSVEAGDSLKDILSNEYFTNLDIMDGDQFALIDVRSQYEFERGHLDNAINIASADILNKENLEKLDKLQNIGKTIALYGCHPEEANIPFMLLYQIGYENIKVLPIELTYEGSELAVTPISMEKQDYDINLFIAESVKKAKAAEEAAKRAATPVVRKPVVVKPKKKKKPEGGC